MRLMTNSILIWCFLLTGQKWSLLLDDLFFDNTLILYHRKSSPKKESFHLDWRSSSRLINIHHRNKRFSRHFIPMIIDQTLTNFIWPIYSIRRISSWYYSSSNWISQCHCFYYWRSILICSKKIFINILELTSYEIDC